MNCLILPLSQTTTATFRTTLDGNRHNAVGALDELQVADAAFLDCARQTQYTTTVVELKA